MARAPRDPGNGLERYNYLAYSHDVTEQDNQLVNNYYKWYVIGQITIAQEGTSPSGTPAQKLTGLGSVILFQLISATTDYQASVYIKRGSGANVPKVFLWSSVASVVATVDWDAETASVTGNGQCSFHDAGDDWYKLVVSQNYGTATRLYLFFAGANLPTSESIYFGGADLRLKSNASKRPEIQLTTDTWAQ